MRFDVYLAAPFFSSGERAHNTAIVESIEASGLSVFYPARDGIIAKDEIAKGRSIEEVINDVWLCDTNAILNSRVILAILDGRVIDEGVCVEIGYAAASQKSVIGFQTDERSCFMWGQNPMVVRAITTHVSCLDYAIEAIFNCLRSTAL